VDHGTSVANNSDIVLLTPKVFVVHALEGLEFAGPELDTLQDIRKGMKDPQEEPITQAAKELWRLSAQALCSSEWSDHDGLLYFCGCIYMPPTSNLCCCIISLCHDTKIAGHTGQFKTLELISQNYWWPNMSCYVSQYVSTCDLCLCTKVACCPLTGELQPLPILEGHWDMTSINLITELPESRGYNAVIVVVDSTGKHAHFIKTVTTITVTGTANLYLQNIWKLHGLP